MIAVDENRSVNGFESLVAERVLYREGAEAATVLEIFRISGSRSGRRRRGCHKTR